MSTAHEPVEVQRTRRGATRTSRGHWRAEYQCPRCRRVAFLNPNRDLTVWAMAICDGQAFMRVERRRAGGAA